MIRKLMLGFGCFSALAFICTVDACRADSEAPHNDSDDDDDTGGDSDTDGDSDGDSDTDGDSDGDSDTDSDGDTDSGGPIDPDSYCDCEDITGNTAEDMAKALNICFQIVALETWSTSANPSKGFAVLESMGNNDCIVAQHGCKMVAISTGPVGQANPNMATGIEFGMNSTAVVENDPLPPYQGYEPTTSEPYASCDNLQLRFRLKAPEGAEGFSFDFLYASAEYNEWINQGFNDAFYAILQYDELNGGEPTNISFDDNNNEIEVDVNFFENAEHPCDESGSGWSPNVFMKAGSTGWLRTQWPVKEDAEFNLTFSIHDEGDCVFDSIVFIDNFQWLGDEVDGGTGPVV
jgi:hypothetical protein